MGLHLSWREGRSALIGGIFGLFKAINETNFQYEIMGHMSFEEPMKNWA
jgi:hypothetical protein